jgi:RNA polymerase sigma-70 factor (ECF subfamily)
MVATARAKRCHGGQEIHSGAVTDFRSLGDDGSPGGRASLDPPDPRVAARVLEATVVHHRRSVIAALTRRFGDLDLAEDAFQDAIGEALRVWPTGMPSTNPAGWLLTVAQRRALDRLRRESVRADREWRATSRLVEDGEIIGSERDDQLALVLTCCHPALSVEAQVALTLKAVAGLSTGIPFKVPVGDDLVDRLAAACSVVYLVFNEGYRASEGEELVRHDVCDEAIRLGRLLHELVPDDDEVAALLALMLLTDARRATRLDDAGELVLLEDQDRSQWDQFRIREGLDLLAFPSIGAAVGPFRIQAEIARAHTEAVSFAHTDWARIASL